MRIYAVLLLIAVAAQLVLATEGVTKIIKIKRENEIEVEEAEDTGFYPLSRTLYVYHMHGGLAHTYDRILLDCSKTCESEGASSAEMKLLSTYASYVHSMGPLDAANIDFGLLKDTESANIYGMFVLHPDGRINFFVRPSVFEGTDMESAYLLLLDIAAHEWAHYANWANNGEFGHNDNFQIEYNVAFWRALENVEDYRSFYISSGNTVHEGDDRRAVNIIIAFTAVTTFIGCCAFAFCLSKEDRRKSRF